MAPTGLLLTIALALGEPGAADPFGPLREPARHEIPDSVVQEISPSEEFPRSVRPAGGWSVSDPPAIEVAEKTPPPQPQPQPAAPGPAPVAAADEAPHALKLSPPKKSQSGEGARKPPNATGAITSIVSSLAVVLGLFFAVVWLARRSQPKGAAILPAEVLEVLGRASLTARQQMHVVRFGNKLLLVSISPGGAETLAEIDDPVEVERVLGICQEMQHGSISETFRQVFSQFANEPPQEGFAGRENAGQALRG